MAEVRLTPLRRRAPEAVRDPARRAALASAYAAVRARRRDPHRRLALAEALIEAGHPRRVYRHLRWAMALAPPDWGGLSRVGEAFFRIGEHVAAGQVFARAQGLGVLAPRAHRTYAALLHKEGKVRDARRMLALSALMEPLRRPPVHHAGRLQVLRLRCFDNSRYQTERGRRSGLWTRSLKSGHFSLADLLPPGTADLHVLSAWGDSLALVEELPAVGVLINTIACADLNGPQLRNAESFLARFPYLPVINHPELVLGTARRTNALRLPLIDGIRFPRTEAVQMEEPADTLRRIEAKGLGYPLILRVAGTQTGLTMEKADTPEAALAWLRARTPRQALLAIEYLDLPDAEGHYRKMRCFFIDGQLYPVASLVSDTWQIHSGDRYRVMDRHAAAQARERAWLEDPEGHLGARPVAALQEVADQIGLDFFGIDFCLDPDGRVVVFEANAAMRHNFDHARAFPYTRPYLERISDAFVAMVRRRSAV
ncbi:hypothetical protein [Histidinibacterium lentulum]|uniref:ATP-grasp domain-containing protein n=1 Tax=Histidinibacterium lentulum TaxID=2480588 RepID=A0A3N2R1B1_9RHOB|nr:hypothetical protein [Histidinibacterium lentulum]ROU01261.1 hypothetical protein EAT49_12145 [Histidinibacterium lentulum]